MPELTAIHLGLLVLTLISGVVLGWLLRGGRATKDKIAVNAGWQEQLESQQSEHQRLAEQNKSLMEQISQFQGNNRKSAEQLTTLKASLNESLKLRDQLQEQSKECRSSLQLTMAERDRLQSAYDDANARLTSAIGVVDQKDEKIARLKRELGNWHKRLPPLVEKFSQQKEEVAGLRAELEDANAQIEELRQMDFGGQTRVEPVSSKALPDGMVASNEPHDQLPTDITHDRMRPDPAVPQSLDDSADADALQSRFSPPHEAGNGRDDLQQIKGIGPAIEKTLNDLGIFRYAQIAGMSEFEIDRVARQLKGFRSRIYREDWLGQARDLHYQKNKHPI